MTAAWRVADERVAAVVRSATDEPIVYVARLPDGPPYVLEGLSALVWCSLPGTEASIAAALAADAPDDLQPAEVDTLVRDRLRELADLGLIVR